MQTNFYDLNNENSTFQLNNSTFNNSNDNFNLNNSLTMDNINSTANTNPRRRVIREGWLYKRGEHIKNWRARYFILYANGDFEGFKNKPDNTTNVPNEPLNNFTVQDCQVLKTDRPKLNTFILRGRNYI